MVIHNNIKYEWQLDAALHKLKAESAQERESPGNESPSVWEISYRAIWTERGQARLDMED